MASSSLHKAPATPRYARPWCLPIRAHRASALECLSQLPQRPEVIPQFLGMLHAGILLVRKAEPRSSRFLRGWAWRTKPRVRRKRSHGSRSSPWTGRLRAPAAHYAEPSPFLDLKIGFEHGPRFHYCVHLRLPCISDRGPNIKALKSFVQKVLYM